MRNINGDEKHSAEIMQLVNKYCLESLIEIEILFKDSKFNSLKYASEPFKNVQRVSFGGYIPRINDIISMNETFPALRNLSLAVYSTNNEYINCFFPHLKNVHLFVYDIDYVDELLRINPQIQNIEWGKANKETLRKLNTMFPQLKYLSLESIGSSEDDNDDEEEICFNNVTTFIMNHSYRNSAKNLSFPMLQEFRLDFNQERTVDWVDFLKKHNHLTRFHLKYSYYISDEQFKELTEQLPNLVEMSVKHVKAVGNSIGADTIIRFIETHEQLCKFSSFACSDETNQILMEKMATAWTIKSNGRCLNFERAQ